MKINLVVLFMVVALLAFVGGITTVAIGGVLWTAISYGLFMPLFMAGVFLSMGATVNHWKPLQIGKPKAIANDDYIRQMESELGMEDFDQGADDNDVLPWLRKYPIPDGWHWQFDQESVSTTLLLTGQKTTNVQLAVYLITDTGAKWKLTGTESNGYSGENSTKWVNPVPADTFEQRLEVTVAKTHKSVMDQVAGQLAMDQIVKKFAGKKELEW